MNQRKSLKRRSSKGITVPNIFKNKRNSYQRKSADLSFECLENVDHIGAGTFGLVTLFRHIYTGEKYAVKSLSLSRIERNGMSKYVLSEISIQKKLNICPFTVSLLKTFRDEQYIYMIMEYVPGGDLFGRLKKCNGGKLNEREGKFIAAEILLGLEALHETGVIYRDLKSDNILIDGKGHIKLADFGFSKILEKDSNTTNTICGTPEYLAPEIINSEDYDHCVDYYAFGCLLYELLYGRTPYAVTKKKKVLFDLALKGIVSFPKEATREAKDLIQKLMHIDKKKRLGAKGIQEIKNHPWFKTIQWELMLMRKLKSPLFIEPKLELEKKQDKRKSGAHKLAEKIGGMLKRKQKK